MSRDRDVPARRRERIRRNANAVIDYYGRGDRLIDALTPQQLLVNQVLALAEAVSDLADECAALEHICNEKLKK